VRNGKGGAAVPDTTAKYSIIIRKWGGSVGMVVGVASHGAASWRWVVSEAGILPELNARVVRLGGGQVHPEAACCKIGLPLN